MIFGCVLLRNDHNSKDEGIFRRESSSDDIQMFVRAGFEPDKNQKKKHKKESKGLDPVDQDSRQSGVRSNTSKDGINNSLGSLTKKFVNLIKRAEDQVI